METKRFNEELSGELLEKFDKLEEYIKGLGSLAVGFSGGVDSSFLLAVAHEVLGEKIIAVTAADYSVPEREVKEASKFCEDRGLKHIICRVDPLKDEGYRHNGPDLRQLLNLKSRVRFAKQDLQSGI